MSIEDVCVHLSVSPLVSLGEQGSGFLGGGGSKRGLLYSLSFESPHSWDPIPFESNWYFLLSIKAVALHWEISFLVEKITVEVAPPSPGFCSHMFVVQKVSAFWCPIIIRSTLSKFIEKTSFHMNTSWSVLQSIWRNN